MGMSAVLQQKIDQGPIECWGSSGRESDRTGTEPGAYCRNGKRDYEEGDEKGWNQRMVRQSVSEWGPAVLMILVWYAWLVFTNTWRGFLCTFFFSFLLAFRCFLFLPIFSVFVEGNN